MTEKDNDIDVVEFLHSHDVPINQKEVNNFYIECPKCTKDNLSISNASGEWHCYSATCKAEGMQGNFDKLLQHLSIDAPTTNIFFRKKEKKDKKLTQEHIQALERYKANKADVIAWAVSRSIDPQIALKAGIGWDTQQKAVVYPYSDEDGKLIGYKCKSDHSQWIVGKEPKLYTVDANDLKKDKVILVEGEADVLTLKGMGLPAVASLGATKEKGFELLAATKRIFIGYDMDPAGQAGSVQAAEKLGLFKCRKLEWEDKDVNDWVHKGNATKEMVLDALSKATKYIEGTSILSAKDAVNDYFDQQDAGPKKKYSWGWPKLDVLTKGWSGGELLGIQAESNTGKTTFLLNAITNIAAQEINCALISLEEHPIFEITPKLLSCAIGKNIKTYGLGRESLQPVEDILNRIKMYKDKPDVKKVADFIRECYYSHDVRCAAVDYFQLLVDDEESVQNIKETMWIFKNLTIELPDLMIPLIVQPKQVDQPQDDDRNKDGSKKRRKKLGGWSMRGGAVINQTLDKALMISAVRDHSNVTQYEYTKCRGHLDVSKNDWLNRQMQLDYDHNTMLMTQREQLIYDL